MSASTNGLLLLPRHCRRKCLSNGHCGNCHDIKFHRYSVSQHRRYGWCHPSAHAREFSAILQYFGRFQRDFLLWMRVVFVAAPSCLASSVHEDKPEECPFVQPSAISNRHSLPHSNPASPCERHIPLRRIRCWRE